ncbi:putative uncharacterized protein [Prevotella sp. CAG:1320]|nr:putative uncharacterized protein [Prevotella sp. CAG:1320]
MFKKFFLLTLRHDSREYSTRYFALALVLAVSVTTRAQVVQTPEVSNGVMDSPLMTDTPALEHGGVMDASASYAPSYQAADINAAIDTTLIHPNALPHWQGWQVDTGPFDIFSSSHEVMGLMGNRTATVGIGGEWGRLYYSSYATMGKYDSAFLGHYNTFSIGGILKLGVTPRLNIGVSGQYTPTAVKSRLLYPYTPTSHYSVMFEFKATKKLWIGFEVGRSFNPVNKSWHSFGGPTYR